MTVAAVLQQVPASNEYIVGSNHAFEAHITLIEIAQGRRHPPNRQHLPTAAETAGVALGAGQLESWVADALGVQSPQRFPESGQAATASAAVKAKARLVAELWRSLPGSEYV